MTRIKPRMNADQKAGFEIMVFSAPIRGL